MKGIIQTGLAAGIVYSFLSASQADASSIRFCEKYAQTSIKQQITNLVHQCGKKGMNWSLLYEDQKGWCMGVKEFIANKRATARKKSLQACGVNINTPITYEQFNDPLVKKSLMPELREAVRKDDLTSITILHQKGFDINYHSDPMTGSLIYTAIDQQAAKVAQYLLENGAKPNRAPVGAPNALTKLIEDSSVNYELLHLLLSMGVDPNVKGELDDDAYAPLIVAVRKNDEQAASLLLDGGANPNRFIETPPLISAIQNRNLLMVKLLVTGGANINKGRYGATCWMKGFDPSTRTLPLDAALIGQHKGIIKLLRSLGAKQSANC